MFTNAGEIRSNLYVKFTCLLRLSELYWVRTNMRRRSELMQLLIGMSIRRYLPAMGTAGFDRARVSGKRRVPRPPPRMIAMTWFMVAPPMSIPVDCHTRGAAADRV